MPAIPFIIAGGASVVGNYLAAKGNKDAAKTAAASDDKALAQAKEIYTQQRADERPYAQSGYGALDALNVGLGLPAVSHVAQGPGTPGASTFMPEPYVVPGARGPDGKQLPGAGQPDPYGVPGQPPVGSLAQLGQPQGGMVSVRSPQGQVGLIPASQLQRALSMGGTQV